MFNQVFSVNFEKAMQLGRYKIKYIAVKKSILASEVLFLTASGKEFTMLVAELPDGLRDLINCLE